MCRLQTAISIMTGYQARYDSFSAHCTPLDESRNLCRPHHFPTRQAALFQTPPFPPSVAFRGFKPRHSTTHNNAAAAACNSDKKRDKKQMRKVNRPDLARPRKVYEWHHVCGQYTVKGAVFIIPLTKAANGAWIDQSLRH